MSCTFFMQRGAGGIGFLDGVSRPTPTCLLDGGGRFSPLLGKSLEPLSTRFGYSCARQTNGASLKLDRCVSRRLYRVESGAPKAIMGVQARILPS